MTIREMEIFVSLVEHKTMRKTAEELFISQPTISGAIATMEEELGVRLFERLGKKLLITASGNKLLKYSQQILNLHSEMYEDITNDSNHMRLRVGATISVGGKLLNSILKEWPHLQPFVTITNTHEIEQKILNSELDLAIVEGSIHSNEIVCKPMFLDKMYLFCSINHPTIKSDKISITQLEGEKFILREVGSGTRDMTLDLLKSNHVTVTELWSSNTIDSICEAVKNNFGVTIFSDRLFQGNAYLTENMLRKVEIIDCDCSRTFHFIYHKDKYPSNLFTEFKSLCEKLSDV